MCTKLGEGDVGDISWYDFCRYFAVRRFGRYFQIVICFFFVALRVEVEQFFYQSVREGSFSECFSFFLSSMGVQVREESLDSVEENDRRKDVRRGVRCVVVVLVCEVMVIIVFLFLGVEIYLEGFDKEKFVMFFNYFILSFVRFTVQVFFVQNEVGFNSVGYYFLFSQMMIVVSYIVFIRMLNFVYKSERGGADMKFFSFFMYSLLFLEERSKVFGLRSGIKVDKSFGSVMMDVLFAVVVSQFMQVFFGFVESSFVLFIVFFGFRVKVVYVFALDRVMKSVLQSVLVVETSTVVAGISSIVFYVVRLFIKFLVSLFVFADFVIFG